MAFQASESEIIWVMRGGILGVGVLSMVMGITIETIYGLWYLCADLVYVILFPQLTAVVYLEFSNTYGSLAAYIVGMFFRITGGENIIGLDPLIKYPYYDEESKTQLFPFKTFTMLLVFATTIIVSYTVKHLFEKGHLRKELDFFRCVVNIPEEQVTLKDQQERAPTPSPTAELAVLRDSLRPPNGSINPALKFSKDDLLTVNGSVRAGASATSLSGVSDGPSEMTRLSSSSESDDTSQQGFHAKRMK